MAAVFKGRGRFSGAAAENCRKTLRSCFASVVTNILYLTSTALPSKKCSWIIHQLKVFKVWSDEAF